MFILNSSTTPDNQASNNQAPDNHALMFTSTGKMPCDFIIKEVNDPKLYKEFIDLPWKVYAHDQKWVPPLKIAVKDILSSKHPFYKQAIMKCWMAINKEGQPVGRIAAIRNMAHEKFWEDKCGFFGFYEAVDDVEVSRQLLRTAESWLKEQGLNMVRGPISPSTNYECGSLVDGFYDSPQIMMTYNPPYYNNHFLASDYYKGMDLFAYRMDALVQFPARLERIANRARESLPVECKRFSFSNWKRVVEVVQSIYNSSWEKNWGFIPFSEEEFTLLSKDLKRIVREELSLVVEFRGHPVGILLALPDYNQIFKRIPDGRLLPTGWLKLLTGEKKIDRIRVVIMGVQKEFRKYGLATLLYQELHRSLHELKQYKELEMSWVLENNDEMNKAANLLGASAPYKTYRIYEKKL